MRRQTAEEEGRCTRLPVVAHQGGSDGAAGSLLQQLRFMQGAAAFPSYDFLPHCCLHGHLFAATLSRVPSLCCVERTRPPLPNLLGKKPPHHEGTHATPYRPYFIIIPFK